MSFDVVRAPLTGINLIEASAGTGKTWTIAALYARLVLENDLKPAQILVVTFTKAATGELRGRIRARLAELAEAFDGGAADELAQSLIALWSPRPYAEAARRLRAAVSDFDAAAIYTIHGFCQRALSEQAVAAGIELQREMLADESALTQEAFDAVWKAEMATISPLFARWLVAQKQSPDAWCARLRGHLGKPFQQIVAPDGVDVQQLQDDFQLAYQQAQVGLHDGGEQVYEWLQLQVEAKAFSGRNHTAKLIESAWVFWCRWLNGAPGLDVPGEPSDAAVSRLMASTLREVQKTSTDLPSLFQAFEALWSAREHLLSGFTIELQVIQARALQQAETVLAQRKLQQGVMGYNDLLLGLEEALAGEQGEHLAQALRTKYPAALIDEFQDTDPLQFAIFQKLFTGGDMPLFLVGDPKQAIYAFRGADLYTYLQARNETPPAQRHTLPTNRRSTPLLVQAVATLFNQAGELPFAIPGLHFPPVAALEGKPTLSVDGASSAALHWLWFDNPSSNKGDATRVATEESADAIARLVRLGECGRARLGQRPLASGDIAVLAATHLQLDRMQQALAERGIASVRISQQSVFQTEEAHDLLQVLRALADPSSAHISAALATALTGGIASQLLADMADDARWLEILGNWRHWHELLLQRGPMAACSAWALDSGVMQRLAALQDGERRLTNLLHLIELVELAHRERPGLAPLLAWFRTALQDASLGDVEAGQMRLESDAARVKLVTIHAAKGLEYPLVFCPYLWDGALFRANETLYPCHEDGRLVLDFGSPQFDARRERARAERLSEKLRQLYVALTRPMSACFIAWGSVKEVATSALGWLLAGGAERERDSEALRAELDALVADYAGMMAWLTLPEGGDAGDGQLEEGAIMHVAQMPRSLNWQWHMASFSRLTAGLHEERPDYDLRLLDVSAADEAPPVQDRFARFPAGPQAGVCLHTLFENWDFTSTDRAKLESLCRDTLITHGLDAEWADLAADLVTATLATPVTPHGDRLQGLPAHKLLVELEFTYTLQPLAWPALVRLLEDPAHALPASFAAAARNLESSVPGGFLKGFIDLSCDLAGRYYVLDYKSNRLSNSRAGYDGATLEAAMAREHYYLQALIYCVALHRYLRWRRPDYDYERHFGGASYLFLRGMGPDAEGAMPGVWFYRPSLALIEDLQALLCGESP